MTQQTDSATWGELSRRFPNAFARLEESLQARAPRAAQTPAAAERAALKCPHCGSHGKVYSVAGNAFPVLRDDCCEDRLFVTAAAALSYAGRVLADPDEQVEQGARYVEFRARITNRDLLKKLDDLTIRLEGVAERVSDSGMCSGAYTAPVQNATFAPSAGGDL